MNLNNNANAGDNDVNFHENDETTAQARNRIYQLRKKNFQNNIVKKVTMLGYIVITLQYIKYGSVFFILIARCVFQSLLSSPFPDDEQLLRVVQRMNNRESERVSSTFSEDTNRETNTQLNAMPGAFVESQTNYTPATVTEMFAVNDVNTMKSKIRNTLFHLSLLVNFIILLYYIFNPIDFHGSMEGHTLNSKGLETTPSPYNNVNGLVQGERRGGITIQLIGEQIPRGNLWSNINNSFFNLLILILQLTLFILTCINFAGMGYEEPKELNENIANGYDGNLIITQINYKNAINILLHP